MSCEDQGYDLISTGCRLCQTWQNFSLIRAAIVPMTDHTGTWFKCTSCNASYGPAEDKTEGEAA